MFFKIDVLKSFAIFAGKYLCWSYFVIKLQCWRSAVLLKRDSNTAVFSEHCEVISIVHLFLIENITWDGFYEKGL